MSKLDLRITGPDGVTRHAEQLAQSITWAGDIKSCARTLDFGLPTSDVPGAVPSIPCELGSSVQFGRDGVDLFDGYVFTRNRDTGSHIMDLSCTDRGLYLKRNESAYKFSSLTPEAITRRVCGDFGIKVGALAETGVNISRNFPGVSLYQIIATAYTLAAEQTGARYAIRFRGDALEVVAKVKGASTLVIQPKSNLRTLGVSESVASMVNRVVIYDENDAKAGQEEDAEAVKLYGLMQFYLKKSKGKDAAREAKKLLEDNALSQKITVTVNGNPELRAGGCAVMRESVTGLYGLFWIDSDTHTWTKDGDYETKLVLNFKNIMDEQEAGSLPKA